MYEKEERMLRGHAEDTGYKAGLTTDEALDAAITEGMGRGKRRKKGWRRKWTFAALAGALTTAALLWLILGGPLNRPEQMAAGPFPQLQGFDFGADVTLNTANRHGLIQPVGKSAEAGDYTVTVEGVLTGFQQLHVFYSVENRSDRNIIVEPGEKREALTGKPIEGGSWSSYSSPLEKGRHQQRLEAVLQDGPLPADLSLEFNVYDNDEGRGPDKKAEPEASVTIDFQINMDAYLPYIQKVPLKQTLEADGQKITLQEAVFSPTGFVLNGVIDPGNSKRVYGLFEPYLESVKDGKATKMASYANWIPGESGEVTYFFASNHLDGPDSITLKAKGLHAVDPEMLKVVVDTDKGVVLRSPENRLKFEDFQTGESVNTLKLKYMQKPGVSQGLSFEPEFVDGKGGSHRESEHSDGTRSEYRSENGAESSIHYLYLKPGDYPQPLTFTLSSYLGLIEKDIEIRLK